MIDVNLIFFMNLLMCRPTCVHSALVNKHYLGSVVSWKDRGEFKYEMCGDLDQFLCKFKNLIHYENTKKIHLTGKHSLALLSLYIVVHLFKAGCVLLLRTGLDPCTAVAWWPVA